MCVIKLVDFCSLILFHYRHNCNCKAWNFHLRIIPLLQKKNCIYIHIVVAHSKTCSFSWMVFIFALNRNTEIEIEIKMSANGHKMYKKSIFLHDQNQFGCEHDYACIIISLCFSYSTVNRLMLHFTSSFWPLYIRVLFFVRLLYYISFIFEWIRLKGK